MKIKQGFYIKQHIESMNLDEYMLILEVENKNIKAAKYGGTPTGSVILNYEDLSDNGYIINVLSDKDVVCITKYKTYLKNGIPASFPMALQYQWNDKEYTIQLKQRYWNGYKWADIPEGFYNETRN